MAKDGKLFLIRKMASQQIDTYVQTVVPHTDLVQGSLITLGDMIDLNTFKTQALDANGSQYRNVYVIDSADVYEDADGRRLNDRTYDMRDIVVRKGIPVRARKLEVGDIADWQRSEFEDDTPDVGMFVTAKMNTKWKVEAGEVPDATRVGGKIEATFNQIIGGESIPMVRVRIVKA